MNIRRKLAIDLGTVSVIMFSRKDGIILDEPSIVAMDRFSGKVLAVGNEANEMLGRAPGHITVKRPLQYGVIKHYEAAEIMLKKFIRKAMGKLLLAPDVLISVPSGATQVEKRAVRQAILKSGVNRVYLIDATLAAALGSGIELDNISGNLVILVGGGLTDIAVISKGEIVVSKSINIAGEKFNESISEYVKNTRDILVGEKTVEDIKLKLGSNNDDFTKCEIQGRNIIDGLPKKTLLTIEDLGTALFNSYEEIANAVKSVLSITPPELLSDIQKNGAIMLGGSSNIRGLKEYIESNTKLNINTADKPKTAVIRGMGRALTNMSKFDSMESTKVEISKKIIENNEKTR